MRLKNGLAGVLLAGLVLMLAVSGVKSGVLELPKKMAHNIYMDPVLKDGRNGGYRAFQIDFGGLDTPKNTYWSLCNWQMAGGFGAYAGLQNTATGPKAIMSFWEGDKNGQILRAHRVYPYGAEKQFGGEGEGTHYIPEYEWRGGQWYRMLLYCWDDLWTGHTFVGQWFYDVSAAKWTLISYFDTNLTGSYITGGLSQFQENYWPANEYLKRSFVVKNIYAYDIKRGSWQSLDTTKISYDPPEWGYQTAGTHEFGATPEFFWAATGEYVADQAAYDAATPRNTVVSILQPKLPEMMPSALVALDAVPNAGGTEIRWKADVSGAPIVLVHICLYDAAGNLLTEWAGTRPELENVLLGVPYAGVARVTAATQDVYGMINNYEITPGTVR